MIRASVEDLVRERCRFLTERQRQTRDHILAAGQRAMADHGRPNIKMATFAEAIQVSPGSIRHYFCDLDNLLAEIFRVHLMNISRAMGQVLRDAPDCAIRRRAAYHAATRNGLGAYTEPHYLLLRDRLGLPPDLAKDVEALRLEIGRILLPAYPSTVLSLVDAPDLLLEDAERAIAALSPAPGLAATAAPDITAATAANDPATAAPKIGQEIAATPAPEAPAIAAADLAATTNAALAAIAAPDAPADAGAGPESGHLAPAPLKTACPAAPTPRPPRPLYRPRFPIRPAPPDPPHPKPAITKSPVYTYRKPSQDYGPAYDALLEKLAQEAAANPATPPSPSLEFSTA